MNSPSITPSNSISSINIQSLGEKMFNKRVLQAILTIFGIQFFLFFFPTSFLKTGFLSLSLYEIFIAPWQNSFLLIFSIGSLGIVSSIFAMAFAHAYNIKWSISYPKRKIDIVFDIISFQTIISMTIFGLSGGILAISYLYIFYSEPQKGLNIKERIQVQNTREIQTKEFILNENYFFIAFAVSFFNVINYMAFYMHHKYLISFPVIEVTRIEKIRLGLIESLRTSANFVISHLPMLYLIYLLAGSSVFAFLRPLAKVDLEESFNLFNLKFHFIAFCFTTLAMMTNFYLWKLIQIYTTEEIIVPIESSVPGSVLLTNCLSSDNQFLKYLGYKKLRDMSIYTSKELSAVFTLSYPGNHPTNWHALYGKSMTYIQDLTNKIKTYNENLIKETEKAITAQLKPPVVQPTFVIPNRYFGDNCTSTHNRGPAFRNLKSSENLIVPQKLKAKSKNIFELIPLKYKLKNLLQTTKFVKYFTTPDKDSEISNVFEDASLVIIALQGLVDISCKSVDDKVNEVFENSWNIQREIKTVLEIVLNLFLEIERFRSLTKQEGNIFSNISLSNNRHIQEHVYVAALSSCERFFYQFYRYFDILCVDFAVQKKLKEIAKPETSESTSASFLF